MGDYSGRAHVAPGPTARLLNTHYNLYSDPNNNLRGSALINILYSQFLD